SSIGVAASRAKRPPLPARNSPTSASAAIASATTTSSSVKPLSQAVRSAHIGHGDPAGQPVDTDRHALLCAGEHDPAAGGAAVGVEADVTDPGPTAFTDDRQQLEGEVGGPVA